MKSLAKFSAVLAAAAVLTFGLSAVEPASAQDGLHQVTASSPCTDVFVLGARGSGQALTDSFGLGPEVYAGVQAYAAQMPGYDVGFDFVSYPAQSVWTLFNTNTFKMFFAGLDDGVTQTLWELGVRAQQCKTERIVLAGYSQGAMVMHRVMAVLASRASANDAVSKAILPRIDGVLAIADGDRYPGEGGTHYDNAPAGSLGVWWTANTVKKIKVTYGSTQKIPDSALWPASRYRSVCHSGDLVCDNSSIPLTAQAISAAGQLHGTIYKPNAAAAGSVISAAGAIAITSRQLSPKTPTCPTGAACTPFWVGYTWTERLTDFPAQVSGVQWITPITDAVLVNDDYGASIVYTPATQGIYPWAVRLSFADGTTQDKSGVLLAYNFPPPVHKVEFASGYNPFPVDSATPYSTITVYLTKTTESPRRPTMLYIQGSAFYGPFTYLGGDSNGNGIVDLDETWTYQVKLPWTTAEPGSLRTATIIVDSLDPLVPNYQFPEVQATINLSR